MLRLWLTGAFLLMTALECNGDSYNEKSRLLYQNKMATAADVSSWIMEGPGKLEFKEGWMIMYSPGQEMHHVFWCPEEFPDSFSAEWEVQNLYTEAGLAIIFFAAKGLHGEDIFSPLLANRDGTFKQYTEGDIRSYHISYYANAAHNKDRGHANLRKNNTFTLLQQGKEGIPAKSIKMHKVRLLKDRNHITMWIDERKIIDFSDSEKDYWGAGKIGFRQMQWSRIQYRNFRVWGSAERDHNEQLKN